MKRFSLVVAQLGLAAVAALGAARCSKPPDVQYVKPPYTPPVHEPIVPDAGSLVGEGEILVSAYRCGGCHQSREPALGLLSGNTIDVGGLRGWAPNLTPDRTTGLGERTIWTSESLHRVIKGGVDPDGNVLCGGVHGAYTALGDTELLAIEAYLLSLDPVESSPPDTGNVCADTFDGGVVPPPPPPPPDGGSIDGGVSPDGGSVFPGTVRVESQNNALPEAAHVADLTLLDPSGDAVETKPLALGRIRVEKAGDYLAAVHVPCPLPYNNECDGFIARDNDGNEILVDTWSFLKNGKGTACEGKITTIKSKARIFGIWTSVLVQNQSKPQWVVSPTRCSDLISGSDPPSTSTAPASSDISTFLTNFQAGAVFTVKGVVTAVDIGRASYAFIIQDTTGTAPNAVLVHKRERSVSTAVAPKLGDYVEVSGTAHTFTSTGAKGLLL